MVRKILLFFFAPIAVVGVVLHTIGNGWFGSDWGSAPVTEGPRPPAKVSDETPQVLFGDLHTHTNYSIDAYVFSTQAVKGTGVVTPADACDFARYCSALDFWSINDHAEGLTPRVWAETLDTVRACNAEAGDPANPDMVSFVGWEWSNGEQDDVPSHYGHKNVIVRTWEEGGTPTRPIASQDQYPLTRIPSMLLGLFSLSDGIAYTSDLGRYVEESRRVPRCPEGVPSRELPDDCRDVAATPLDLYRKLDEWGYDSLVIPHGLAWGTTNPLSADFLTQMDQYEVRYQRLLETFSGHGSSERFEDFQRIAYSGNGTAYCPEATDNFTPCCRQAGAITRSLCADPESAGCKAEVDAAMQAFVDRGVPAGRKLYPDASLDDWAGCGQLRNTFQPASMYVPRMSTQYNLALGFDAEGNPKRTKFGLIGSSDNHLARPGSSYKETNRVLYTDNKDVSGEPNWSYRVDKESGAFYYTGGLVAVHSAGRNRDAIWEALERREVYATSGDRILLWFDLLNAPGGAVPMGSEVSMEERPRFRVRALGALEQQPGCPDAARGALGEARIQSLCGGECFRPGDRRKPITRVEIVRIRPQVEPGEAIAPLVEDNWRVFDCPANGEGCTAEFDDPDYVAGDRPALYYARAIQAAEPLIAGDPFGCEYDEVGNCISRSYCIDENAGPEDDCTAPAEPRAWSSPIFLEHPGGARVY